MDILVPEFNPLHQIVHTPPFRRDSQLWLCLYMHASLSELWKNHQPWRKSQVLCTCRLGTQNREWIEKTDFYEQVSCHQFYINSLKNEKQNLGTKINWVWGSWHDMENEMALQDTKVVVIWFLISQWSTYHEDQRKEEKLPGKVFSESQN